MRVSMAIALFLGGVLVCAVLASRRVSVQPSEVRVLETAIARHRDTVRKEVVRIGLLQRRADTARTRVRAVATHVDSLRPLVPIEDTVAIAVIALQDTALHWANLRAEMLDSALQISEVRAARADTLLRRAQEVVRGAGCRVLWMACPSRKAIVGVTVVAMIVGRRIARF